MMQGQVRDNTEIQEKAEKKLPQMKKLLYRAADLMFPCSQEMFGVCAGQFPLQAVVGKCMSQTASLCSCRMEWMEQAVAALHLHLGKCTVTAPFGLLCAPSYPSLTALCDGKILDLAHLCQGVALSCY